MKRAEREELVGRLRAIHHPDAQALADELEPPPMGRRPGLADVRAWTKVKRVLLSHAAYEGVLPERMVTESRRWRLTQAHGKRKAADGLAGVLLHASADTVETARRGRKERRDGTAELHLEGDEVMALLRILTTGKPPTA